MPEELEWKTRKERIDKKLKLLSIPWNIIKYNAQLDTSVLSRHAVEEYPTVNGPADYALFVKGKLLGIIEGKRVAVGPQNVLEQAKRYSRGAFDEFDAVKIGLTATPAVHTLALFKEVIYRYTTGQAILDG